MDDGSKLAFLENIFGQGYYSGSTGEALFYCPFCRHYKKKLSINLNTDLWHCWVCDNSGRDLVYLLRRFGTKQDVDDYVNYYKADSVVDRLAGQELQAFRVELPHEFTPLVECEDSFLGRKAMNYLINKRGLTRRDVLRHKIGTAMSGEYKGRIIFPSFDARGNINFFTARAPDGQYWSPNTPRGYKNQIILNEMNIDWSRPIEITEGYIDMIKAGGATATLFGSKLHEESALFRAIVKNGNDVYLALDADAQLKAAAIAEKLMRHAITVYNVDVSPFKDIGEMTREEHDKRLQVAKVWTEFDILNKKLVVSCSRSLT